MAEVRLEAVCKSFGQEAVIRDLDLTIADGEFCVFLGPSGCGKSTLLRLIAGLADVTSGRIRIGGTDVTELPPKARQVAMVFQSYALYPHMTAYQNMAFGLRLGRRGRQEVDRRVRETARSLHIEHLLERRPAELSGGQQQRVAIGRAVVREPRVFLFDEPLSNLDTDLRTRMRAEFGRLHDRLRNTMVYVTHDQAVGQRHGLRLVVGHIDHGASEAAMQAHEFRAHAGPQIRVQVGQGLVEEKHPGLPDHGPSDGDPLLLASRELGGLALQQVLDV